MEGVALEGEGHPAVSSKEHALEEEGKEAEEVGELSEEAAVSERAPKPPLDNVSCHWAH